MNDPGYLKLLLDAIFGPTSFRNEIVWRRTNARSVQGYWPRVHDVLLFYGNGPTINFNAPTVPADASKMPHTLLTGPDGRKYQGYELTAPEVRSLASEAGSAWRDFDPTPLGRHWANAHATMEEWDKAGLMHWPKGGGFPRRRASEPFDASRRVVSVGDVWTDIDRINQAAKERLGYPTQKPVALLERILEASSAEGDVVLDPFCGCGTTIDAAQRLRRRWIGIDVTYLAVDLIDKRLRHTYGDDITSTYKVHGIPHDMAGAHALFDANPFDFERWAVSRVDGQPNEKQVGDKGADGIIRFPIGRDTGRVVVSVKGGRYVNPAMARELLGTVNAQHAAMGVLITMDAPTRGVRDAMPRQCRCSPKFALSAHRKSRLRSCSKGEISDAAWVVTPAGR